MFGFSRTSMLFYKHKLQFGEETVLNTFIFVPSRCLSHAKTRWKETNNAYTSKTPDDVRE